MPLIRVRVLREAVPAEAAVGQSQSLLSFRSHQVRTACLDSIKSAQPALPPLQMNSEQKRALSAASNLSEEDALRL